MEDLMFTSGGVKYCKSCKGIIVSISRLYTDPEGYCRMCSDALLNPEPEDNLCKSAPEN